jgi:hypothetical protein
MFASELLQYAVISLFIGRSTSKVGIGHHNRSHIIAGMVCCEPVDNPPVI